MSVIATISIPAADFTLGAALAVNPGIQVRLERVIPVGDTFIPYFWASDDSVEDIQTVLENEADIDSYRIVDTADGEALVRVDWAKQLDGFLDAMARTGATVLEAVGEKETWRFQLRFEDHDDLTAFYRHCADEGVSVELESLHNPGAPGRTGQQFDLTDQQRETLQLALERGYFDVPRRTNLVELSEELGISDSATSQRLRRGIAGILGETITGLDGGVHDHR